MSKIKVSELFYSLQGEGLYLGTPSIFLRVFGCNFTCAGFSMPRGQKSEERLQVDPTKFTKYEELPLVHTGCDSYPSWDPRFKHLSPLLPVEEIVEKMKGLLPGGKFNNSIHLIITGGEPLLGWQRAYPELFRAIREFDLDLGHVTFETNGTQPLSNELRDALDEEFYDVTYSISSKLPSSGESWEKAIRPDIVDTYFKTARATTRSRSYFKWVVSSPEDLDDVKRAVKEYRDHGINIPVYLMPAGGTTKHYDGNEQWVAEMAMKNGFRYSPRLQVGLWKNQWAT